MLGGALDVGFGAADYLSGLLIGHFFYPPGRDPYYETAGRELFIFRDQRAGGDDRTFTDLRPIE
jgi:hypothetical protein